METINTYFSKQLSTLKESGALSVCYALLAEALIVGYLGFIALFTVETLLPTFVTGRFSLTQFFLILFLLTFSLIALGRYLDISFDWKLNKKSPTLWFGLFWMLCILAISLYKFPLTTIPIIIAGFFLVGFLFWKILFNEKH
ncbi:MAG: hypothetical protein WAW00_00275 [Candidatus Moraniibacteriota bacterium]